MLNNNKFIPIKNYIYLLLIIIASVALVYYLYLWFIEYNKEQNQTSYIEEVMQIINYNELETYLIENKDAVVYVSVLNDNHIRKFEKKLQRFIKENDITNKILYLDLTNNNYEVLNKEVNVPTFLVYRNTELTANYEIDKKDYDIKKIKTFLEEQGVIVND